MRLQIEAKPSVLCCYLDRANTNEEIDSAVCQITFVLVLSYTSIRMILILWVRRCEGVKTLGYR